MNKRSLAAVLVVGASIAACTPVKAADDRYPFMNDVRAWRHGEFRAKATHKTYRVVKKDKRHVRATTVRKVLDRKSDNRTTLNGVVAPLAEKVRSIIDTCGSHIMSAIRHTRVAGSGNLSLHASGRAVDVSGNPSCIYSMLHGWPGGYSIDYWDVRCVRGIKCPHVHISYNPGGREWGTRSVHYGTRVARRAHARSHSRKHGVPVHALVDGSARTAYVQH